jgi:pimeloyl-ACP methyl ester carboxylesterase
MPQHQFVLIHGAWHGGWCWKPIRRILEARGACVFTPTLTGLGERAHLTSPVPSLDTHVEDVLRVIEAEELHDVVLVGHSYAGMVITAVADRIKPKLRHLVYIDAAVPADGQDFAAAVPGIPAAMVDARRAAFRQLSPDGVWLPPLAAAALGVSDPADAAWLERRMTPHPLRTWLDPVHFTNGGHVGVRKTYVVATDPPTARMGYPAHAEVARRGGEWRCAEIACGHHIIVVKPQDTANLLLQAAA